MAAAVNLLLVPVAVIFKPGGGSSLVKVSWSFGAFAGLIAAIAAFARWPGRRCAPSRAPAHRD